MAEDNNILISMENKTAHHPESETNGVALRNLQPGECPQISNIVDVFPEAEVRSKCSRGGENGRLPGSFVFLWF